MKKYYRKLIRDKIPQIIERRGGTYKVKVLKEREFAAAVRKKLLEETREAVKAPTHQLGEELADVFETIQTLASFYSLSLAEIKKKQTEKRKKRGGFAKRLYLIWSAEK